MRALIPFIWMKKLPIGSVNTATKNKDVLERLEFNNTQRFSLYTSKDLPKQVIKI